MPCVWVSPHTVWPLTTCTRQVPQVPARQSCGISTPWASAPSSRTSPARTRNARPLTVTVFKLLIVHSSIGYAGGRAWFGWRRPRSRLAWCDTDQILLRGRLEPGGPVGRRHHRSFQPAHLGCAEHQEPEEER